MRRMRKDRFLLGSSADVPDMWSHAVLRQLTESARQQTRARQWTSGDRVGATGERWLYCYPDEAFTEY